MSPKTQMIELGPDVKINVITSPSDGPRPSPDRPALVFLHFWGGSSRTWSLVVPHLTVPWVCIDLRGWGESTGPADPKSYSIGHMAHDVELVIQHLQLGSVILVGLSMGAKVTMLVAAHLQTTKAALIRGLILVSPAPPSPLSLPPDMRDQQIDAYTSVENATFVARNVLTRSFQERDVPDFLLEDMLKGSQAAREAWPVYSMAEDISPQVQGLRTRILILAAEHDVVEPLDRVEKKIHQILPDSRLKVLDRSGHLSPIAVHERVGAEIMEFFRTLP